MSSRISEFRTARRLEHVLKADAAVDSAVVSGFAKAAADHLAAGPLNLAARAQLLTRGERLGLGRFDANLILAVVERRHRAQSPAGRLPAVRLPAIRLMDRSIATPTVSTTDSAPPRRPFVWPAAAVAVVLQVGIIAGAWWLVA